MSKSTSIRSPNGSRCITRCGASRRSYFYDPNLHGVNVADGEKEYEKYLDSLASRNDLNYIIHDMLSEMTVGHLRGGGGNIPDGAAPFPAACLAPITRSRTVAIASSESIRAKVGTRSCKRPLAAPGLNVSEGDYLLAVNGQDLPPPTISRDCSKARPASAS